MAFAKTSRAALFMLLICPLLFAVHIGRASSLSFFYNFSDPTTFSHDDLYFEGDAYIGGGSLILTKEQLSVGVSVPSSRAGRISYRHPVDLWSNDATGEVTGFSTSFSFVINGGKQTRKDTGGGLAFFLAPYPSRMPHDSEGTTLFLGLFNSTTAALGEQIVAVELDTHGDVGWDPTTLPHVGVDLNTLRLHSSRSSYKVVGNLADGEPKVLQLDYNNRTKLLLVTLRDFRDGVPAVVTLETSVDLRRYLPKQVAVGFSVATDVLQHQVLWWSFSEKPRQPGASTWALVRVALEAPVNSSAPPPLSETPDPGAKKRRRPLVIGVVVVLVLLGVTTLVVGSLCCLNRRIMRRSSLLSHGLEEDYYLTNERQRRSSPRLAAGRPYHFEGVLAASVAAGLRRFSYQELLDATDNFSDERLLGEKGVSAFYRGDLQLGIPVAVKKLELETAEIVDFFENHCRRLPYRLERHRNIVELLGWCHEGHNFCFVYEFVNNGSLHDHLYGTTTTHLTWPMRYNIILGLGTGLHRLGDYYYSSSYRSEQYDDGIVLIRPSNLMLDESFNVMITDFWQPQPRFLFTRSGSEKLTTAASRVYMDSAEQLASGSGSGVAAAWKKSMVYSFGIVMLEVVCGRPPIILQQQEEDHHQQRARAAPTPNLLVDHVWELYEAGAISDAADSRMNGEFDRRELERVLLVALWCAHPNRRQRPCIDQAIASFELSTPEPTLAPRMPTSGEHEHEIIIQDE